MTERNRDAMTGTGDDSGGGGAYASGDTAGVGASAPSRDAGGDADPGHLTGDAESRDGSDGGRGITDRARDTVGDAADDLTGR